jgi:hypothetical protein
MAFEITNSGGFLKIKNTTTNEIKAISKNDVRFELEKTLDVMLGANFKFIVISDVVEVSTPVATDLEDLLTKLNNLT